MTILQYGHTKTYFINGLLIDTDYAGTINQFFKLFLFIISLALINKCFPEKILFS